MSFARIRGVIFAVALVVAVTLVVVLSGEARTLRAAYKDLAQRTSEPHAGIFVPTFPATTLGGAPVTIGRTTQGRQVLFVFTTTCPFCLASLAQWNRLAQILDTLGATRTSAYGLSLDSVSATRSYAARHSLRFPVIVFPEHKLVFLYRARVVPLVMVLDSVGRVLYARLGVLTNSTASDSILIAVLRAPPRPLVPSPGGSLTTDHVVPSSRGAL
jgi:peroxiredoxin